MSPTQALPPSCRQIQSRMINIAAIKDVKARRHRRFFRNSDIYKFFTNEVIRDAISCSCDRCTQYRKICKWDQKSIETVISTVTQFKINKAGGTRNETNGYILGLALLLYNDYTAAITHLVKQRFTDDKFFDRIRKLGADKAGIAREFWPFGFDENNADVDFAEQLREHRYCFTVPFLERHNGTSEFDELVLLPMINEEEIGIRDADGNIKPEGTSGSVYSVVIPEGYHDFPPPHPESGRYVYKKFRDKEAYLAEHYNLNQIRGIRDKHIIQYHKAYTHGAHGCILFSHAKTNLKHYLRDDALGAEMRLQQSLQDHPFWEQLLGLARALRKVLEVRREDGTMCFGYHFDLKPANILIGFDGVFIIADFGRAHFVANSEVTSSRLGGFGANEAYAPPEYDSDLVHRNQNRTYDIFSLGCIFLEVVVHMVGGSAAVRALDKIRQADTGRFIDKDDDNKWRVKLEVLRIVQDLVINASEHDESFLSSIRDLILGMMMVDSSKRLTYKQLCDNLAAILAQRAISSETRQSEHQLPAVRQDEFVCEGRELGAAHMAKIRVEALSQRGWRYQYHRFGVHDHDLTLYTEEANGWHKHRLGDIRYLRLAPLYAFNEIGSSSCREATICVHDVRAKQSSMHFHGFRSTFLKESTYLQESLLGHTVNRHLHGEHSIILKYSASQRQHARRDSGFFETFREHDVTVQFWEETVHAPHLPRPRRLVFFTGPRIHILKIDQDVRLRKQEHNESSSLTIETSKHALGRDFSILTLGVTADLPHPSIPLRSSNLRKEEEDAALRCHSLTITFESTAGKEDFRKEYNTSKYSWEQERRRYSDRKALLGPQLGYAPNS